MMLCFLFSGLIVALDQFFKHWVLRTIENGKMGAEIIPGVLALYRYENDGAMLGILSGKQWLLAGIAFVAAVVLIMILLRYNEGFWGTIGLAAVLGGTVGNLIDRIFNNGAVIDMFRTLFINFPIFNIADIFITLGFITFLVHFIALTFKAEQNPVSVTETEAPGDAEEDLQVQPIKISASADPDLQEVVAQYAEPAVTQPAVAEQQADVVYAQPEAVYAQPEAPVQEPVYTAPVQPAPQEAYAPVAADYVSAAGTVQDISLSLDDINVDLDVDIDSLDVDYDVDELLREYGLDDDEFNV